MTLVGLHTFSPKLLKSYIFLSILTKDGTKIIFIEIYAVLSITKVVAIHPLLVCKFFGLKIQTCKLFDKFQVCDFYVFYHFVFMDIHNISC